MPRARQRATLSKHNIRNGALLVASEAVKLVNIPVVQDVAEHVKQLVSSLKTPKINDSNAQDLANRVRRLSHVLDAAVRLLKAPGHTQASKHAHMVAELCQFQSRLSCIYSELQVIQLSRHFTKMASQTQIQERITGIKDELSRTIVDLTLRLLVAVLASGSNYQLESSRRFKSATREHAVLARRYGVLVTKHNTLARVTRRHQRLTDKRIRGLERDCKKLTHHVDMALLMQSTDKQRIAFLVLSSSACVLFSNFEDWYLF
ncbi:hypothetical protein RSOL_217020 [Rhizoctonia solani AG-3 Rhs1AP]|nr:hypothetical protein RSOL_217020 [Rhizoctonia solani AG-3 Rhs1AP]KEP50952.1 hypothetical protein V565_070310 [Rhizoctonia solani 123E]